MDVHDARRRWSAAQGLNETADEPIADTLARTGWLRTLGGTAAYLALGARNARATVAAVNAEVAAGRLRVMPAARGCMYLVPEAHAGLARRLSVRLSERRMARELERAGTDDAELERLGAAVREALEDGPASTAALRKRLGDAVRSLGAAGKKVGLTSTLPPALRRLEMAGRLVRKPVDDRLDHERYDWALAADVEEDDAGDDLRRLAEAYLAWAGPTTAAAFSAWTGLSKTDAKRALAAVAAAPIEVEGWGAGVVSAAGPAVGPERTTWLGGMDNLYALRPDASALVDPAVADLEVANFGRGTRRLAEMSQPLERTIVHGGQVVGLWAYDPVAAELVQHRWGGAAEPAREAEEAARVRAVFEALGTSRVFSLDNEDLLVARAARLRALGAST